LLQLPEIHCALVKVTPLSKRSKRIIFFIIFKGF
jgi:hypothetical protein